VCPSDIGMSSAREDQTVVNIRCAEWVGKPEHDHMRATVPLLCGGRGPDLASTSS
jgi:hypothetical protein